MRRINLPGILFLAALAGLWQLAAFLEDSPTFPSFTTVIGTLVGNRGALLNELAHTLLRAAAGFGLALGTMLPLGIFLDGSGSSATLLNPSSNWCARCRRSRSSRFG